MMEQVYYAETDKLLEIMALIYSNDIKAIKIERANSRWEIYVTYGV